MLGSNRPSQRPRPRRGPRPVLGHLLRPIDGGAAGFLRSRARRGGTFSKAGGRRWREAAVARSRQSRTAGIARSSVACVRFRRSVATSGVFRAASAWLGIDAGGIFRAASSSGSGDGGGEVQILVVVAVFRGVVGGFC
ncbi:hypothetical protein CASFOL_002580 [Castilleja foliolosa]|uniref:Uncharacterized protein n=1 Tax=Castilleja foliolosa TaxID=1961234 RepID=A0ABD3EI70_9LAMI